ncbi:predicted protein [Postia placenta Mad-698-R]|uniref:Histone chaperone domain-containing protein n=2 Tax=Rhodonia placenta TaxID=104341 RepID=A0A1X6NBW8_9APHY|nr:hypothetical protein POSPLADRAFT_1052609 [Postia placenta MAD-698-R-SB12]EED81581.1 predicted protein [Postia placenta Mad-698-R]KAF9815580.1 hypothetical protein IEO21_04501 [Postia placenta]OSX65946.1 hypothetical protein POSPLADRAFT_1052609 [Postia placenta MAD-698-R-SB12]
MSTDATSPSTPATAHNAGANASPADKGKGKGKFIHEKVTDDSDDDDEEEEEEEEDDDMEEDDLGEIDPSAIITGTRRTRGVRVDYSSAAALAKAGLKPEDAEDDEGEESFVAKDDDMHDD